MGTPFPLEDLRTPPYFIKKKNKKRRISGWDSNPELFSATRNQKILLCLLSPWPTICSALGTVSATRLNGCYVYASEIVHFPSTLSLLCNVVMAMYLENVLFLKHRNSVHLIKYRGEYHFRGRMKCFSGFSTDNVSFETHKTHTQMLQTCKYWYICDSHETSVYETSDILSEYLRYKLNYMTV